MKGRNKWLIAGLAAIAAVATVLDVPLATQVADVLLCVVDPLACGIEA